MTSSTADLAQSAARALLEQAGIDRIDIALTLGSGWGRAAEAVGELVAEIPADSIPGFQSSGVIGHSGTLSVFRLDDGRLVLVIGARTHLYEGRGIDAVAHGVRTAAAAGAKIVVLTNGAGGINSDYEVGEAVLISDHINLTAASPLVGSNFVDLTDLYSADLRELAREVEPSLRDGVYAQVTGPHFETPAEIQYFKMIGADAVGMSTALEAIAAREAGLKVLGFTLITNLAAGISPEPLDHEEVIAAGKAAEARLGDLLGGVVAKLPR
ncbi:MAG: purine-nucleoside phosphorylase [Canibacter sp.]